MFIQLAQFPDIRARYARMCAHILSEHQDARVQSIDRARSHHASQKFLIFYLARDAFRIIFARCARCRNTHNLHILFAVFELARLYDKSRYAGSMRDLRAKLTPSRNNRGRCRSGGNPRGTAFRGNRRLENSSGM